MPDRHELLHVLILAKTTHITVAPREIVLDTPDFAVVCPPKENEVIVA